MSLILHDQVKVTQGGNHCTIFLVLLYVAWRFYAIFNALIQRKTRVLCRQDFVTYLY